MKRRKFLGLLGGAVIAWPGCSSADWSGKVWRVGIVQGDRTETQHHLVDGLTQRLAELGYQQGKNIVVFVDRPPEPTPEAVENTIASLAPSVDLLVVGGTIGGVAAKKLVATKPVVFISVGAPVDIGLVQSLAHPGGNMTGSTFEAATETYGKRLQILKEIMPSLTRVAVLQARGDANVKFAMASLETAAPGLGVQLTPIEVSSSGDLDASFDRIKASQSEALIVVAGALTYSNGQRIADLALARQLPSCHAFRETVAAGGLVSLGPDLVDMWRQAADFVDKIIRGAEPKDLPVQQPTRYELAINLKTAKALGLTIPQSLLSGADTVFE